MAARNTRSASPLLRDGRYCRSASKRFLYRQSAPSEWKPVQLHPSKFSPSGLFWGHRIQTERMTLVLGTGTNLLDDTLDKTLGGCFEALP